MNMLCYSYALSLGWEVGFSKTKLVLVIVMAPKKVGSFENFDWSWKVGHGDPGHNRVLSVDFRNHMESQHSHGSYLVLSSMYM